MANRSWVSVVILPRFIKENATLPVALRIILNIPDARAGGKKGAIRKMPSKKKHPGWKVTCS